MGYYNELAKQLTDFERKLITIIQHNSKKGKSPTLEELEMRSGHSADEIKGVIKDLIKKEWLGVSKGKLIVLKKLF